MYTSCISIDQVDTTLDNLYSRLEGYRPTVYTEGYMAIYGSFYGTMVDGKFKEMSYHIPVSQLEYIAKQLEDRVYLYEYKIRDDALYGTCSWYRNAIETVVSILRELRDAGRLTNLHVMLELVDIHEGYGKYRVIDEDY